MFRHFFLPFLKTAAAMLVFLTVLPSLAAPQSTQSKEESPLEVKVSLSWYRDNIKLIVDRTNRSPNTLYLPVMGTYISVAVNEEQVESSKESLRRWVNIHGVTDIVSWEANPMAPGATVHDEFYFWPAIFVVNLKKETRRLIPLRGVLKTEAYYFLSEQAWLRNRTWHDEAHFAVTPLDPWNPPETLKRQFTSVETRIPCRASDCASLCSAPPIVLAGEDRVVPDVYFLDSRWGLRGDAINQRLTAVSPNCSKNNSQAQ